MLALRSALFLLVVASAPFLVCVADSHVLPASNHGPWRWLRQHNDIMERARALQQPGNAAAPKVEPVSWPRLMQELRVTQKLSLVVPASALSLLLTATDLIAPRLRGKLFDAVLLPGASMAQLWPRLRVLALLALAGWLASIVSSILFARARWTAAMAARVRLMDAVLEQEPAFFDVQQPGELNSRLLSEPERLEALANRGPERMLSACLSLGGALGLMLALDWRLTLVAVALRAPLIGRLAKAAGRTVGALNMLQQRELNEANAVASEALAQPHAVAAHAARRSLLATYAARVEAYMAVIRSTLLAETTLRFTRLGVDSATSLLLLGCGLLGVLRDSITIGSLTAFYACARGDGLRTPQLPCRAGPLPWGAGRCPVPCTL